MPSKPTTKNQPAAAGASADPPPAAVSGQGTPAAPNVIPSSPPADSGTGFDVQVVFEGLCVFVPGPRCSTPNVMRILLPNACSGMAAGGMTRAPAAAGTGCFCVGMSGMAAMSGAPATSGGATASMVAGGGAMPPHLPFVAVDYAQICELLSRSADGAAGQAGATAVNADPKRQDWWNFLVQDDVFDSGIGAVRFIEWEDVSLGLDDEECDLKIAGGRLPGSQEPGSQPAGPHGPGTSEQEDFSWVAELDSAAPGSGEINPHCFDTDPPRNLVIGRMRLTTGAIKVSNLAATSEGRAIWEFRCSQSGVCTGYTQALASEVTYTVHVEDDVVTLCLRRFRAGGGTSATNEIQLAPTSEKPVKIIIGNLPLPDILAFPDNANPLASAELHFIALYALSQTSPPDPPVPSAIGHPSAIGGRVGGVRGGTIICPGGTGKASDLA